MIRPLPRAITAPRAAFAALAIGAIALTTTAAATGSPAAHERPSPTFADVTVHDPSVVTSGDQIWVFGSHGASAVTTDLMNWTQHTVDLHQEGDNALFEDIYADLAETFAWAQTDTLWAADVIQLPDGRFAMYYNACKGDSPRSALGLAIADDVDGPYVNQGILLKSGMWGEESENPGEIYDATVHPNTVDPDAFVDADGTMWMVYGSYSGGIFILEMDAETGLPLPDQGYGTHLIGGNHARIEAPTIQYNAQTGFYYLYLSFGGLDASGGYEVRAFRSTSPDGPYVDAAGRPAAEALGAPGTLFDDVSIAPYGNVILDGHLFPRELGDPGTGMGVGYVSPGHNSWYQDPDTGDTFLIFHSRFPGTGELHQVRAQRVLFDRDGWPVVSPMRYAGESAGKVRRGDVTGTWQLVELDKEISASHTPARRVTLTANGRIEGDATGTWKLTAQHDAQLIIDGTTWTGAFTPIWDPQLGEWTTGLTVRDADGVGLWGRQSPAVTGAAAVDAVLSQLDLGDTSAVTSDLALPTTGTGGTTVAWASSDPALVTTTGDVTRPAPGEPDGHATLTATVTNAGASATATFGVTVLARVPGVLVGSWDFEGDLNDSVTGTAATPTGDRIGTAGVAASYVADGIDGQALHLDGTAGVQLPDGLIAGPEYTVSMSLRPAQLTSFTTAFFGAVDGDHWISLVPLGWDGATMLWSGSQPWYDARTLQLIPANEWTHVAFTVDGGDVTVYLDGVPTFSGAGFPDRFSGATGVFALGVNWWDAPFNGDIDGLTVWSSALTAEDVAALAS